MRSSQDSGSATANCGGLNSDKKRETKEETRSNASGARTDAFFMKQISKKLRKKIQYVHNEQKNETIRLLSVRIDGKKTAV